MEVLGVKEDMTVEFIKHYGTKFKYVIAPHEMRTSALDKLESSIEHDVLRYSNANLRNAVTAHVLIIDNIGY